MDTDVAKEMDTEIEDGIESILEELWAKEMKYGG